MFEKLLQPMKPKNTELKTYTCKVVGLHYFEKDIAKLLKKRNMYKEGGEIDDNVVAVPGTFSNGGKTFYILLDGKRIGWIHEQYINAVSKMEIKHCKLNVDVFCDEELDLWQPKMMITLTYKDKPPYKK